MNKQKEMTARNTSIAAYYLKINRFVVKGGGRNG